MSRFLSFALALAVSVTGVSPAFPQPLKETSYLNFKHALQSPAFLPESALFDLARAHGQFEEGHFGLFTARLTYDFKGPPETALPSTFQFWRRNPGTGLYRKRKNLLVTSQGCIHPRKALMADFNGDARPDVFVVCHGYDADPFPGEKNKVVLSRPDGKFIVKDASDDVGFFHGGTAFDVDVDGDIDVLLVDNSEIITLLNDGAGNFAKVPNTRFPALNGSYYSIEAVDVDEDGLMDLLVGGHEFEGGATVLILGDNADNVFLNSVVKVLPAVPNEGVVLDFTVTGTGATRSIWIVRTSGGDGTFYQSRVVQRVKLDDLSSEIVINQRPEQWIPWLAVNPAAGTIFSDSFAEGVSIQY